MQLLHRQLERVLGEGNVLWVSIGACSQVAGDDAREEALVTALLLGQDAGQELQEALGARGEDGSDAQAPSGTDRPQPPATLVELQQVVEAEAEEWAERRDVSAFFVQGLRRGAQGEAVHLQFTFAISYAAVEMTDLHI